MIFSPRKFSATSENFLGTMFPRSTTFSTSGEHGAQDEEGGLDELPEELERLVRDGSKYLDKAGGERLRRLISEYRAAFASSELDLGTFKDIKHHIDTGGAEPIKVKMRRTPVHFVEEESVMLEKMLEKGVIRPSTSAWAAAPVLVRKKDGKLRWCVDFRGLNGCTVKDQFPLARMEDCMDALDGNV